MRLGLMSSLVVSTFSMLGFACVSPDAGPKGDPGETGAQGPKGDPGEDGADAVPCAVADNGNGTMTITCPGSEPVTVKNGADGAPGKDGEDGAPGKDGEDGAPGTNGTNGTNGTDGKDGTSCTAMDNGDGSQTIDCTDGTHVYIQPQPMDPYLDGYEALPGVVASVVEVTGQSNTDGTFAPGDRVSVTFRVRTAAGRSLPLGQLDAGNAWLAGPVGNYQHILPTARDRTSYNDVRTAATYNGDGTWTYTFPDPIPATFGVPLFDTTKFSVGELTGPLTSGTYMVAFNFYKRFYVEGQEELDSGNLLVPIRFDHASTTDTRSVVQNDNCARCHDTVIGHGGRYTGVDLCVTCHASGAEDRNSTDTGDATNVTIDFKVMMHKLHNAAHLPSVLGVATKADGSRDYAAAKTPYIIGETDFSGILYPAFPNFNIAMPKDLGYSALATANRTQEDNIRKGVTACADCHGDPDGAGPKLAPTQGNLAFTNPTKAACQSCHDDVDYAKPYVANGQQMPGGATLDLIPCATCHTESTGNLSVRLAHQHPIFDATASPEVTFNITAIGGGTGADGKLQAGDRPTVSFTLKNGAADVPLSDFTSVSLAVTGPTSNRQVVIPGALTASPFDFAGRLAAPSTTNKGVMSKVLPNGTSVSETLTVEFTSSTAYKVTGTTSGLIGTGTLSSATSTYASGASLSNIVITSAAPSENLSIEFTSPTAFDVKAGTTTLGSSTLANATSTVTRFTSPNGSVAFNLTVGTTAFTAGQKWNLGVFKGTAPNPVTFAISSGTAAFAVGDRFYYDYIAPAATYTIKVPMDLTMETLGKGDGTVDQVLTAANAPVWYGRQTLFEVTAQVATPTALSAASGMLTKHIYVASTAGLANNDYIVLDEGQPTVEYVQLGANPDANGHLTLRTPLRYTHAVNAVVREVTLTTRFEGTNYTLDSTNGTVTLKATSTNPFVMSYRTDGRFGWKRSVTDALQTVYYAPLDSREVTDETWGDWRGKPIIAGTYTFALWGYIPYEYGTQNEWQTYRATTKSSRFDALYGSATTVEPYALIESGATCATCHNELSFHGGGREGGDTCFLCHGTPGGQVHFNTILHEAHEAILPVMPNGSAQCTKCHGTANVWEAPTNRNHPTAQVEPVRDWSLSCTGCHSWPEAVAHTDIMTSGSGVESCKTCHGIGKDLAVRFVHKVH